MNNVRCLVSALSRLSERDRRYLCKVIHLSESRLKLALDALKRFVVEYENYHVDC